MTASEYEAQIWISNYYLNSLCTCELNEAGRNFIKQSIEKIKTNINDTRHVQIVLKHSKDRCIGS
jgi:hypothetical protein